MAETKVKLRMKCGNCGSWNRFEVRKIFIEQTTQDQKVKAFLPVYEPLKTETCKKCRTVSARRFSDSGSALLSLHFRFMFSYAFVYIGRNQSRQEHTRGAPISSYLANCRLFGVSSSSIG